MRTLCFMLFSYLLISCSKPSETLLPELSRAESLMQEYPDSALAILDSMQVPSPSNEMQYATWCLFRTQAQDKNYIIHTSDSLINIALSYFERQNDLNRKMLSFYYKGRVEDDSHNVEDATTNYLKAKEIGKELKDYKILQVICSNLGMVYAYRNLSNQALPEIKEAYKYATLTKDSTNISYFLSHLGRLSAISADWDSCIYYYNQAIEIGMQTQNLRTLSLALNEVSRAHLELKEYEKAIDCLKKAEKIRNSERHSSIYQTYLILGCVYIQTEKYDSATYYLNKSLKTENVYTITSAYQNLYLVNEKQSKFKEAVKYNNLYQTYVDSLTQIAHAKEISEIQAKYEHEKLINKNNQLEIQNGNILKIGLSILIIIICIVALTIYIYQRKLIKKERDILNSKKQILSYTISLRENEAIINNNDKIIQTLTAQLEKNAEINELLKEEREEIEHLRQINRSLKEKNKVLQININRYSKTVIIENDKEMNAFNRLVEQNARLLEREKKISEQLTNRIDILNCLKQSPKYIIDEQWTEIIEMIDILYDNYTQRLHSDFSSLTDEDLHYCCLIKLQFSTSTMSILTGISPASVTKRKQRIKEKINLEKFAKLSKEQSIESYLWSY